MNLLAIRNEIRERGYDDLSDTRLNYFVNRALHSLAGRANWPFLQADASRTAPLTINDLAKVLSVRNLTTGTMLRGEDPRTVLERDPDSEVTGSPELFYLPAESTVAVWPDSNSDLIAVRYLKFLPDLSADADIPGIPSRYHSLIVDGAVAFALLPDRDAQEEALALRAQWEADIQDMKGDLLDRNLANPPSIVRTAGYDDYGA